MEKWERYICALRKTADNYPQGGYSAVARGFQSEWIFLQYVMKDTRQAFTGIERVMRGTLLYYLLFGK